MGALLLHSAISKLRLVKIRPLVGSKEPSFGILGNSDIINPFWPNQKCAFLDFVIFCLYVATIYIHVVYSLNV